MKKAFIVSGSIASGKSSFIKEARNLGFDTLNADEISHQILNENVVKINEKLAKFKINFLQNDKIDKKLLGNLIFSNKEAKSILEDFLHPKIRAKIRKEVQELEKKNKIFFVEIPLFFESNYYKDLGKSILIYAPKALMLERLMARNSLNYNEAISRINSQMNIEKKKALADFILENTGDFVKFRQDCVKLIKKLEAEFKENE